MCVCVCEQMYFCFILFSTSFVCWLSIRCQRMRRNVVTKEKSCQIKSYPYTRACVYVECPIQPRTLCSDLLRFFFHYLTCCLFSSENKFRSYFRFYFSFESAKSIKEKKTQFVPFRKFLRRIFKLCICLWIHTLCYSLRFSFFFSYQNKDNIKKVNGK